MTVGGRSVFISYRRQRSWSLALAVRDDLIKHRYDTFLDANLDSGEFPRQILSQIEAREHFIVLLQPGSLDRIGEDGDWLRREIAHALAHDRNVVPVTADGFVFRRDLVLPPDVARLPDFNAVPIPIELAYFDSAMERLRTRFLKMPSKPTAPPLPKSRSVVEPGRSAQARSGEVTIAGAPVPPAPQLTGRANVMEPQLTWSEVSGAHEYMLERAKKPASRGDTESFVKVYNGPDLSYNDHPAQSTGVAFWHYRVRASAFGQAGRWSDTLELRTGFE